MKKPKRNRLLWLIAGIALLAGAAASGTVYLSGVRRKARERSSHERMVAVLKDIERRTPEESRLLGDKEARTLRQFLASLPPNAPPATRCGAYYRLGLAEQRLGREREAFDLLTSAYRMLPGLKGTLKRQDDLNVIFYLGVSCMRLGETENCCLRHTPESCVLPIRGGGIHTNQEGSRRAIGYFMEVLSGTQPRETVHLQSCWLLNLAYMTLGEYPARVPPEHLIPPAAFESEEPFPHFPNIAQRLGVDTFFLAGGAIADDFDNDEYIDLVVSSSDTRERLRYFHNERDGTFREMGERAGLGGILGGLNIIQADYDNDGHVDLLVLRGGWLFAGGRHPNSLLHNNGDGTFLDVTFAAGLGEVYLPTQTATWFDDDNDGDLDLFVGNESTSAVRAPCQLFRNNGDGTFTDVAKEAGVTNDRFTKGVISGDYNGDGFPDIFVGNLTEPDRLYRNDRNGRFTDVAAELGLTKLSSTFPCWFWDFDNDGALDLLALPYYGAIEDQAAYALGLPFESELPCLYRGDGRGGFEEVGQQRNLKRPSLPMGANFGDLDGDGYLDFYLGTGDPDFMNLMPNLMYHNRRGKSFADVTANGGFGNLQKGHAVVFADFDNDGDQDIFEEMGGAVPGDRYHASFYENPGFGNQWITVKLIGVRSNRSAIGARIRAVVLEEGKERSIYKHVNSGGTFGANPFRQNLGLGKATRIVSFEVFWPTTGKTQTFHDVPLAVTIEIVEGKEGFRVIPLERLVLGGKPTG